MTRVRRAWAHLGVLVFNIVVTHVPVRQLRLGVLRLWGARIGRDSSVFRGTTVLGIELLRIGTSTNIGFRCMLDARGGLTIGDNVVVASDTHFIAGTHDINSSTFEPLLLPTVVGDYAWLTSRVTVTAGVTIGRGAVVAACALVRDDVEPMAIMAGVPAKRVGTREAELTYSPGWHPIGF